MSLESSPGPYHISPETLWAPPAEAVSALQSELESPQQIVDFFKNTLGYIHSLNPRLSTAEATAAANSGNCYGLTQITDAYFTAIPGLAAAVKLGPGGQSDMLHANNVVLKPDGELWEIDVSIGKTRRLTGFSGYISDWIGSGHAAFHIWNGRKRGGAAYGMQMHSSDNPAEAPPILHYGTSRRMFMQGPAGRVALAAQSKLIEARAEKHLIDPAEYAAMKAAWQPMVPALPVDEKRAAFQIR